MYNICCPLSTETLVTFKFAHFYTFFNHNSILLTFIFRQRRLQGVQCFTIKRKSLKSVFLFYFWSLTDLRVFFGWINLQIFCSKKGGLPLPYWLQSTANFTFYQISKFIKIVEEFFLSKWKISNLGLKLKISF